jgi:hypothetical protein
MNREYGYFIKIKIFFSHSLSRKSVPELDEQLFQQIQLNVSRINVVLQEEEANRHHHEN